MSADELNTLRAEALPADEPENVTEVPADAPVMADPGLSQAMVMMVAGLSAPICRRANVTGLEREEADLLGQAIAQLVTVYDLGPKDPKGAAWMGFGMAAVAVIGNRRPLAPVVADAPAKTEEAPPPPSFGQPVQSSLGGGVQLQPMDATPCA